MEKKRNTVGLVTPNSYELFILKKANVLERSKQARISKGIMRRGANATQCATQLGGLMCTSAQGTVVYNGTLDPDPLESGPAQRVKDCLRKLSAKTLKLIVAKQ